MTELTDCRWFNETPYPVGGEASPPSEVALVNCLDPRGYHRVAHGGIVKLNELLCVVAFIDAVGL